MHRIAFVGAAMGWWLIVVHPTYLICTTRIWKEVSGAERVAYSLGAVLLVLIVGGVLIDVLLPPLGIPRPLALRPILWGVDVMNIGLLAWRIRRVPVGNRWLSNLRLLRHSEWRVLTVSACCVPLVVAGANRLNNDHGDLVSLIGLSCVAATFALLLGWRKRLRESVIATSTYLLGLSLLLATSLRGWEVTGHDIQGEYFVFQLTKARGVWNIGALRTAFDACLSITILPTEISQIVRVDDPYVFKFFFQTLFAVCPVLVYLLARRYSSTHIAILSVVYFVGFPTFFTDMPFINRQEIAYLFLGLAFLATTRRQWTVWRRRIVVIICALGIGLSHYSTMYVFIGTLAVAWVGEGGYVLVANIRTLFRKRRHAAKAGWADAARTVTLGVVVATALMAGGVITRTGEGVVSTVKAAFPFSGGAHSNDTSYGLLSAGGTNSQALLDLYQKETLQTRKANPTEYLPLSDALAFPVHALNLPRLPRTRTGNLLADIHVNVAVLNDAVRFLAAKSEQVFVGLGLLAVAFVAKRRRKVGRDFYFLCVGSVVMLVAVTILPGLSVNYGVLRVFQQALIIVAPILVIGSIALFRPLGRTWARRAATVLALIFLVSTIGVLPQVLGGYPAQLNLNNSGEYYDDYYVHPQELEATQWLNGDLRDLQVAVQATTFTIPNYIKEPLFSYESPPPITDIFPTLIQKSSWVMLEYSTVKTDIATVPINGDLIEYRYPTGVLNQNKDLVYDNGGTVIYK